AQEMIDQALRQQEMARAGVNATQEMVDQSYANFAKSNNLSVAQLDQILAQSGVTQGTSKEFLRSQTGWGRLLQSRSRTTESLSEQDVVQRMLQQGEKPTATEYMLQQVIFVVPAAQRGQMLARRKREAQAMRDRFNGCDTTVQ